MTAAIATFLGEVPLFADLTEAELTGLAARLSVREVYSGEILVREGEPHQSLLVVWTGRVIVTRRVVGDTEAVLAHLGPGSHLGELHLLDAGTAAATVTAERPCRVLVLDRARFRSLLSADEQLFGRLAWGLMRDLTGRIRRTNQKLQEVILWGLDATSTDPAEYRT